MNKKRNELLSEIEKKAEKKVTKEEYMENAWTGSMSLVFLAVVVVIPTCIMIQAPFWIGVVFTVVMGVVGFIIGFVNTAETDLTNKIKKETEHQTNEILHKMANKTEMYALSSIYVYQDLKNLYLKHKDEEPNLSTLQSYIVKRNDNILQEAKKSILDGYGKRIVCPLCQETITVQGNHIEKPCLCKGVNMYKQAEKSSY